MFDVRNGQADAHPTLTVRRGSERGGADHGWLETRHTFSFADYYDPAHMGFRALRVINDDRVAAGAGFPTHPHRDMEILTYVLDGVIEHRDSMGNGTLIRPGEVQRMTAGTGVRHSEFNHSEEDPLRLLQIWIVPAERGLPPSYEQRAFSVEERSGTLRLVASPDGAKGSVTVHQDVRLYAGLLSAGQRVIHRTSAERHTWIQLARGAVVAAGIELHEGDGLAVSGADAIELDGVDHAEVLLFDLS